MQKSTNLFSLALYGALLLSLASCNNNNNTEAEQATVTDAVEAPVVSTEAMPYSIVPEQSKFTWIGAKLTGNHNGTIQIQQGTVLVQNQNIVGGKVVFDMTSLRAEDVELDEANNQKLTGHLMSPDFFDVAKHPTANFEITNVEPITNGAAEPDSMEAVRKRVVQNNTSNRVTNPTHMVTGNLTIKDVTKSVTFPAQITVDNQRASAQANFIIDRTDWKLTYMSEKSFADKMIFSEVNIIFDLVATR